MDLLRAAALTTQLCERRTDLIRLFGEATYQERTALAKARIREVMALRHDDNALSAAIAFCKDGVWGAVERKTWLGVCHR